jgi:hypothetical protein
MSYATVSKKIRNAGYVVTREEEMGTWSRITICGETRHPESGYTGNSFWVTCVGAKWYIGAWGGSVYRARDVNTVVDFSIAWLKYESHRTMADFDVEFVSRFGLQNADGEFDKLVGADLL